MTGKAKLALAGFALAGLTGTGANGAVVLSDNFDSYSDGNLVGQGGWTQTGTSTTNLLQVAGGTDKHVQFATTGQDAYKAFTSAVPHTDGLGIATSFTVNLSAAQTGDYFSHLSDPVGTTTNFYQRVFARSSGAGFQMGLLDTSGTGSTTTWGSTVLDFNTEYDIDVTWNFVAGGNNDTFSLTVNGSPYLTHTWTSAIAEPNQVSAANLRQGGTTSSATLQLDDYVVDAVPEPAALGLVGLAAVAGLRRQRRA